jgi:hypothetical protein
MAVDTLGMGDLQNLLAGNTAGTTAQICALQKAAIPKLTTTARDALASPDLYEGLMIYNTTTHKYNIRVAAAWEVITSA